MAALERAFALAEVDHVAVLVAQDLEFDVAGGLDLLFDINVGAAESLLGFGFGGLKQGDEFARVAHDAHAAAAAAFGGFDHYGVADFGGDFFGGVFVGDYSGAAGNDRESGGGHGFAGFILFAHQADGVWRGADEGDVRGFADFGEIGVFGEEAVAGMDGVHVGDFGGADYLRDVEIAFAAAGWADANGFVGEADVEGVAVGLGIDGDGFDAEFTAGGEDAERDFAAIGD